MNFSLSYDNIKEIPFNKYEKNFTFIVNGKRYDTSRYIADLLSPIIRRSHYTDESLDSFNIKYYKEDMMNNDSSSNEEDYFNEFLSLTEFNKKTINEAELKHYIEYFIQLGNMKEFLRLQPEKTSLTEINPGNVIDRLSNLIQIIKAMNTNMKTETDTEIDEIYCNSNIKEMIKFASSHFSDICKDQIKSLPIEMIREILNEETLEIEDEDSLLNFILELYLEEDKYSNLFEYVNFSNLSKESLNKFIENFNIDDINQVIWESIFESHFGLNEKEYSGNKRYKTSMKTFEHDSNKEFDGIMRHLSESTKGNIHDNGTIEITANSLFNNDNSHHPKNVVDYSNNNYYDSNTGVQNGEVCFDFKNKLIQLTEYSIKTSNGGQDGCHLRSWVVEASNDKKNWEIVDQHEDDSSLRGSGRIVTFKTKVKETNSFYRYIRIRQTGKSWSNSYDFIMYYVEFYGKLKESSK